MAIPVWPQELPRPIRRDYARTPVEARFERRPDAGPGWRRRRYSAQVERIAMTLDTSIDQFAMFRRFFEQETAMGSLPFVMTDHVFDGQPLTDLSGVVLTNHDDEPLLVAASMLVQFSQRLPEYAPTGVRWRITFEIEVLP